MERNASGAHGSDPAGIEAARWVTLEHAGLRNVSLLCKNDRTRLGHDLSHVVFL